MLGDVTDPLEFVTEVDLKKFFHCKKTEMSCIEEPNTFLTQLRDHNLVPEVLYQKVIKMKSKERQQEEVYKLLDWLEKQLGHCVKLFWTCVFKNHMLEKYPVLRLLRKSLLDGSFRDYIELLDAEEMSTNVKDVIQSKENKARQKTGERKRKKRTEVMEESEKPGPSPLSSHNQNKPAKKDSFEEESNVCMYEFDRTLLVTCGDKEGTLCQDKLASGYKSIQSQGSWFTPSEFERFAGTGNGRTCCQNTPLHKLIVNQNIQIPVIPLEAPIPQSLSSVEMEGSGEGHEEEEEGSEAVDLSKFNMFALPVSCGSVSGILYKSRFTGSHVKSIRTEKRWFSPEEFVGQTGGDWEKDILCHGKSLNFLLKKNFLSVHPPQCPCSLCAPVHPSDQDNDDVCFICNSGGNLVCCDACPRAFHHQCHLPELQERSLGKNWMCTFCVLKVNQGLWLHMTNEDVLNSPVSGTIMHCEYLLLCLYKEDTLRVFTQDPTATVPRYTRVISKPMWLELVKTKLQKKEYKTVREFVEDIKLIFKNCHNFNKNNEFGKMGARLSEIFEREFRTIFKIQ